MFYVPVSEPPIGAIPLGTDSNKETNTHSKQICNNSLVLKENCADVLPQICDDDDIPFNESQKVRSVQHGWCDGVRRSCDSLGDSAGDDLKTRIEACSVHLPPENHFIEDECEAPFFHDFDDDLPHPPPPFDTTIRCENGILPMNTPFPVDGMVSHANPPGIGVNISVLPVECGQAPEPMPQTGADVKRFRTPSEILFSEERPITAGYRSPLLFDDSVAIPPPPPPRENLFD